MPWFRNPHQILSRLLTIGTTVWICRKVGCWARHFGRLGALVLRFVRRGRLARRMPDYGHLLLDPLYPGRQPTKEAARRARELADMSKEQQEPDEALRLLGEAVLLCPPDASLHLLRAEAHVGRGQLVEALDDAELAVSLDSSLASGWLLKGQAEWALGRKSDAALSYQAGLRAEPSHPELYTNWTAARGEPPPNLLRQLRDLVFAARLGLENLFQTVEDPGKTTDSFVEQNADLLDAQIGLLQQTLRVNTAVLLESPILSEAYEQIVHACSQLVAGAPAAFSKCLRNAGSVVEGLSLALRVGWHVHHSTPKLAANALVVLATCPNADDGLRRQAVRHLLAGCLRWLLDARPEPDREGEEVCGCSCSAPWKAAACFLERLLEPGRPQPWVKEECEKWPDAAQLCQWLTLSVRDYHATPLGLVGLLQLPGVAAAAMRSEAVVDFFIPPLLPEEDLEGTEGAGAAVAAAAALAATEVQRLAELHSTGGAFAFAAPPAEGGNASASSSASPGNAAWLWSVSNGAGPAASVHNAAAAAASRAGISGGRGVGILPGTQSSSSTAPPHGARVPQGAWAPIPAGALSQLGVAVAEDLYMLLPSQRLGEWLMASVGYLLLFVEGDVLFTVAACRALQALAMAQPEGGEGTRRLLQGLWLGVPLLNKLCLYACSHTAALDLLHCMLQGPENGVRVAARSLAAALARPPLPMPETAPPTVDAAAATMPPENHEVPDVSNADSAPQPSSAPLAAPAQPPHALILDQLFDDETVPSWAEFYQELRNELACGAGTADTPPELVTLVNFEEKAPLLAEQISIQAIPDGDDDHGQDQRVDVVAVPAAWNFIGALGGSSSSSSSAPAHAATSTLTASLGTVQGLPELLPLHYVDCEARAGNLPGGAWEVGSEAYESDPERRGKMVLMSRRSIRQSSRVQNWAQAVAAAERAGAIAVIVFNNLDALEPFRMGLFGEQSPAIPAFMVGGADGATLVDVAKASRLVRLERQRPTLEEDVLEASGRRRRSPPLPTWPLSSGRLPSDVAQAWSLLEALARTSPSGAGSVAASTSSSSSSTAPAAKASSAEPTAEDDDVQAELATLLARMSSPEKRVWLTRRLVRHHRTRQAPEGDVAEPPLAFVEGDRSLSHGDQLNAVRRQLCEEIGLGAEDLCGEFEVRYKDEQGVGSALLREWMDLLSHEVFLHPRHRLLRSYDRRQSFWPDPAAPFVNPQWQMDYEALGRLMGLALWQSCTLDLPLHPHVCALVFGFPRESVKTTLADCDQDLYRLKVQWLLEHPVNELGFDLPYSDALSADEPEEEKQAGDGEDSAAARHGTSRSSSSSSHEASAAGSSSASGNVANEEDVLPAMLRQSDRLEGNVRAAIGRPIRRIPSPAEVALSRRDVSGDAECVTDENKADFVVALEEWRLYGSIDLQVEAIAKGLRTVVPEPVLEELRDLLSAEELTGLLSGIGEIDVDDWEKHTAYMQGLSKDNDLVKWFWRTVRSWAVSAEESVRLSQLLQFVTGSGRVPVGGFAELVGFNGAKHPFTLSFGAHLTPQSLPMAHACICTLDLPPYPDEETCRAKLTQTILLGRSPFDEAAGRAMRGEDDD